MIPFWQKWVRPKGPLEVDRSQQQLGSGKPVPPDHSHAKINPKTGMQQEYVVLTPEERAKGFIRPVRLVYTHLTCKMDTRIMMDIAETYARDPKFYDGTFCFHCRLHLPLHEFVWQGTDIKVGT